MSKVQSGVGQQKIQNLEDRGVQQAEVPKAQAEVQKQLQRPGELPVSDQAIDGKVAGDFAADQNKPKTGQSPMDVRLGATSTRSLDDFVATLDWNEVVPAKDLMSDSELDAFQRGDMPVDDFKGILEQARSPMAKDELRQFYPGLDRVYENLDDADKARLDAGQMSPAEYCNLQDGVWSDVGNSPYQPPGKVDQPEDQKLYKPTDIMSRLHSGRGHNVMFGGQLMDRAVLGAMFDAIQGQGDGRVSRADVQKFLPHILDSGKITTSEENAILFGFKYCRFTKAADRELASAIADKFPDSAVARYGSLSQPPRFKDCEQYDFMDFSNRSADLYGAKGVMSPAEFQLFADGDMTLVQFNNVLKRANQPMQPDELRATFGEWTGNQAIESMTDAEHARFDAGKMCPAEFQNIQYRGWEQESPSLDGKTPYQEDYRPGFKPFVADSVVNPKVRSLNQQLAKLNDALDRGDIDGMLALFKTSVVKEQLDFLVSEGLSPDRAKEHFLLEAILAPGTQGVSDLSQIEDISLDTSRIEPMGNGVSEIFGVAILKNGDAISANILLDPDNQLTSAVG